MNSPYVAALLLALLVFCPAPSALAGQSMSEQDLAKAMKMIGEAVKQMEAEKSGGQPAQQSSNSADKPTDKPAGPAKAYTTGSVGPYSADMADVQNGRVAQKLAVTRDKVFSEGLDDQGMRQAIAIIRLDQKKMYVCLEANKSYWELPFDKDTFSASDLNVGPARVKREKTGSETVNGHKAEKWRITATAMGVDSVSHEWLSEEFGAIPIRTESQGSVREMRNVRPGEPDASLFEIPAGYTRDAKMEQLMKVMLGGK